MALSFFENALKSAMIQMPNEEFRELQQAAIDDMWEVTTARYSVLEQDDFGPLTFHEIEVWFDYVVGVTSTFMKNGNDYRKLIFKSIDHECNRGRYYKFDNSYWIVDFTDPMITVQKFVTVRRCNNWLRMVDPENGAIVQWPCVIDYDATSPSPQIGSNIITPNNHLTVMVQGNKETSRLFKYNTRFMLGSRPFKIQAFQNAIMSNDKTEQTNLLYLNLYLDELHDKDNKELQLAYNGEFNYSIQIESNSELVDVRVGQTGKLYASILLNGQEVDRKIEWKSNYPDVVVIDYEGEYTVLKKWFKSVTITAFMTDNPDIKASIQFNIVNKDNIVPIIDIIPDFTKIRQYEIIDFNVETIYDGKPLQDIISTVSLSENEQIMNNQYLSIQDMSNNQYTIEAVNISNVPQLLYITVESADKQMAAKKTVSLEVVSMMG